MLFWLALLGAVLFGIAIGSKKCEDCPWKKVFKVNEKEYMVLLTKDEVLLLLSLVRERAPNMRRLIYKLENI